MGYEEREETKFRLEDVSLDRKRPYESVRPECHYDLKPVKLFTPVIQHSRPRYDLENQFVEEGVTYDFREDYDSWRHIGNRPPVDPNTSSLIPPEPSILNEQFTSFGFRYTAVLDDGNSKNTWYSHTDLDIEGLRAVEKVRYEMIAWIQAVKSLQDAYRECKYRSYLKDLAQQEAGEGEEVTINFGPAPTYIGVDGNEYSLDELKDENDDEVGCPKLSKICEFLATTINNNMPLECELVRQYIGDQFVGSDLNTWWWEEWLDGDIFDEVRYADIDINVSGVQGTTYGDRIDTTLKDRYVKPPYQDVIGVYECKGVAEVDDETGLVVSPNGRGFTADICGCVDPDSVYDKLPRYIKSCVHDGADFPNYGEGYPQYLEYVGSKSARFWNTPMRTPLLRRAQEKLLRSSEVSVEVPGDFGLAVGQFIKLLNTVSANVESVDDAPFNMLDGEWLIVGVKHSFEMQSKHITTLTCVRDGLY